ncbi:MAG: recombination-associated protein RdgC [Legionellales bacterium]|nr:recombination-associated protein RdgC [Legionellales bacterium]|tara:strand:+ start:70941 stop:71894 length:954 start_codon:yes stop_codon:yes gene_type:complete
MWFKNIQLFQILDDFDLNAEQLHNLLSEDMARHCGQVERSVMGWVSPFGDDNDNLVCAVEDKLLIAARKEEKILPTTVVRDHVQEKIKDIQAKEDRKVSSREKRQLFDEMSITLLPRAFAKHKTTFAYIDKKHQWLIIDAVSREKAEEVTVLLRQSLGSLKLAPVELKQSIPFAMTQWLQHDAVPSNFTIDDMCDMQDPNHTATIIKCVNQNLFTDEVQKHLTAGKQVIRLAMTWHDRVSFVVDEKFAIKRLRFLDLVQEQVNDAQAETPEEHLIVNFTLFSAEFEVLLPVLFSLFGGLADESKAQIAQDVEEAVPV